MQSAGFIATAWNNGKHHTTGAGYGLKISVADRDTFMRRAWGSVDLHLSGAAEPIRVNIAKDSFWSDTCRELISQHIGHWLIAQGLAPWPDGKPPRFRLVPRHPRGFDVLLAK
jgi:hypothetical protein